MGALNLSIASPTAIEFIGSMNRRGVACVDNSVVMGKCTEMRGVFEPWCGQPGADRRNIRVVLVGRLYGTKDVVLQAGHAPLSEVVSFGLGRRYPCNPVLLPGPPLVLRTQRTARVLMSA